MPKVYRVQDSKGCGPYQNPYNKELLRHHYENHWDYPGALEDFQGARYMMIVEKGLKFAFPSLTLLCDWFNDTWDELEKRGYSIVEIDATIVYISNSGKQCVYVTP